MSKLRDGLDGPEVPARSGGVGYARLSLPSIQSPKFCKIVKFEIEEYLMEKVPVFQDSSCITLPDTGNSGDDLPEPPSDNYMIP